MRRRAIAAAAVPAVIALGAFQADRYLHRKLAPAGRDMPHEPEDVGLDADDVWVTSSGGTALHAWFAPPPTSPAPAIVILHGWGANASLMLPIAALLQQAGFAVTIGDVRGHGHSEPVEHVSQPRFADDLEVFVDFTAAQPEVGEVSVLGHSVGAAAALLVASRRDDLAATVAVGSFADARELMRRAPGMQRLPGGLVAAVFRRMETSMGCRFDDIAPVHTIGDARSPVMIVHGADDAVIPMADFERLGETCAPGTQSLLVAGGVHDRLDEYLPHVPEIVDFVRAACGENAGRR
jgi:alpha-beta hydrolase superfamily lysophospholipase